MFKRKQDVDKHVLSVLNRKRDEKERNAQGYQIARLYLDIKEYETAKKYLANFLHVRENSPQAHQMMGEVNEALGKKDLAIENYKRALDLGGFGSSNRQLVLKICELYCDLGTDEQRMKYWLQKCESLYPQSEIVYRMKSKLVSLSSNGSSSHEDMERLLLDELVNRPTDLDLRIKLLQLYVDSDRIIDAYETSVDTDLTTAFVDALPWYECVQDVFEKYAQENSDSESDTSFMLMNMHVLRNATFLSLSKKSIQSTVRLMKRFDKALKEANNVNCVEEAWLALLREMKGQLLYLAGLILIKRAMLGSMLWQEVNQLCGACLLASRSVPPIDAQTPWFVKPQQGYGKFYNWWHLQSYERLSQVGRMIHQLSQGDVIDWTRTVHQHTMNGPGHRRAFEALFSGGDDQGHYGDSFFYDTDLMVASIKEPMTPKQLLDIDRVAYQVNLGKLSHLVWLCLQRYSPDMDCQPNYHFSMFENIQFSVRNLETAGSESLCQLDVLTFLLASVRCAATSISENVFSYEDQSGRPTLLPVCLSPALCTPEQEEWWSAVFKFCSNSVRDSISHHRRVLIRGVEVVRLKGTHGMSIPMQCHLARSLDAKVKSLRESEYGCRCSAADLTALEARALFYWQRAYEALQKVKKNQQPPVIKNRLFKEAGDGDLPPNFVNTLLREADFAIALSLMNKNQAEDALEKFQRHPSPWAPFYSAQICRNQALQCQDADKVEASRDLFRKSRDMLYKVLDRLSGDKSHELNYLVNKELDDLEIEIQGYDMEDSNINSSAARGLFHTPSKSASNYHPMSSRGLSGMSRHQGDGVSHPLSHSTPRNVTNGISQEESIGEETSPPPATKYNNTPHVNQVGATTSGIPSHLQQPRPSPERLDSQIKSLGYSQTTLFKTVLDRNEELVLMHSRMMEEHRNHNNQLQTALSENKNVMEDLKGMLTGNQDMLKGLKTSLSDTKKVTDALSEIKKVMEDLKLEVATVKNSVLSQPAPMPPPGAMPPGAPLLVAPHLPPAARGAYPGFPAQGQYPGYLLNSPMPPQAPLPQPPQHAGAPTAGPNYRPSGLPGSRSSQVGKFKPAMGMPGFTTGGEEDEDEEEEDLEHAVEDLSAMYPEYFSVEDQYSHYYTPEAHIPDWSLRSGMEPSPIPLSMPPPVRPPPPRMAMPQPGFFASALQGQAVQYAQQQSTPISAAATSQTSKLGSNSMIGPGFFTPSLTTMAAVSTYPTSIFSLAACASDKMSPASPSNQGNIPIFAAMTNAGSNSGVISSTIGAVCQQPSGLKEALVGSGQGARPSLPSAVGNSPEDLGTSLGFQVLFHNKASYPSKKAIGGITILLGPNNQTSVIMMSDKEELLFQHDANGLILHSPPRGMSSITWSASKIGSLSSSSALPTPERETVTIYTIPESMGNLLREALQKAAASVTNEVGRAAAANASSTNSKTLPANSATAAAAASKTEFGGFSFSTPPVLTPSQTEREKATPHKGATSPVKITDAPKPFAGVSLTVPKFTSVSSAPGTPSFSTTQASPQKTPESRRDDERVVEYEPNVDFKPVIPLPELVEKKTGEENETTIFMDRCRLYRYDKPTNQWKERGIGEVKILSDNQDHRFRVVMRRDQIFKLCANHFIAAGMKLSFMANSEKTLCYNAMDYSDEEMKMEQLAFRFKNQDKAKCFQEAVEKCVEKLKKDAEGSVDVAPTPNTTSSSTSVYAPTTKPPMFSLNPQSATASSKPAASTISTAATSKVPAFSTTGTIAPPSPALSLKDLGVVFKPKPGSWQCDACMCQNGAEHIKCPACGNAKPGSKPSNNAGQSSAGVGTSGAIFKSFGTAPSSSATGTSGGFAFGSIPSSTGGLFGSSTSTGSSSSTTSSAKPASTTVPAVSSKPGGAPLLGELFKPKAGSWNCEGCLCQNQADHMKCPACGKLKPGVKSEDVTAGSVTTKPSTGFDFSGAKGFAFKMPASQPTTTTASSSTTKPSGGFSFGPLMSTTTAATPSAATTTTSTASKTSTGFSYPSISSGGFNFNPTKTNPVTTATTTSTNDQSGKTSTDASKSSGGLLASLLTTDDSKPDDAQSAGGFNFTMTPGQKSAANQSMVTSSSSGSGFNFSFQKSPSLSTTSSKTSVPKSPEVDDHGLYVTKDGEDSHIHFEPVIQLPDKVEAKTGEEEETVLFESRARMYRFTSGEWKERGVGVMKILEHKKTMKSRLLMRRDQVLKICCNHIIKPDLDLQPMPKMEGKAWLWYALDFSEEEGKMEQLAIRFKKPEIAQEFKDVFDKCKGKYNDAATTTPQKACTGAESDDDVIFVKEEKSPGFAIAKASFSVPAKKGDNGEDDDVIFLEEEEAMPEQKMLAAKYKLPTNFYLYLKRKPCPGCIGCTDGEGLPSFAKTTTPKKESGKGTKSYADVTKSPVKPQTPMAGDNKNTTATPEVRSIFGSNGTPSAGVSPANTFGKSLFGTVSSTTDQPSIFGGPASLGKSSMFGSATTGNTPDFSSLLKGSKTPTTTSSTPSTTSPFGVFGAGLSTPDFSSLSATSNTETSFMKKADTGTPFKFQGAGQKIFGAASDGAGEGDADGTPSSDVHFEPIIPLPELVEVKTGEEDWANLFCHRAKLYKYDPPTKQWKERGIGDIKIMSFNKELMFRILQRREQVLKLSCNHLINKDMKLNPMSSSETAWCWVANDMTEEEPSVEQFAVKFKAKETAQQFKTVFEECQQKLIDKEKESASSSTVPSASTVVSREEKGKEDSQNQKQQEEQQQEEYDEEAYEDDEDEIIFEKRATLSAYSNGEWKVLGMGQLRVEYDDDLNGNSINFVTDDNKRLCRHVICREHDLALDQKNKSCEWRPLDYSTDEPIRRHFRVTFSSLPAAEEFAKVFTEGKRLAMDSELSENLPRDIDVPEVFSRGEIRQGQRVE